MQIILLSGGSGKRLWPLSNGTRSKQFLKLLNSDSGEPESMIQRVIRQINHTLPNTDITIATSGSQKDAILSQIGNIYDIITEPERRDTFPAILLATSFLIFEKKIGDNEPIIVMPCDPYTEKGYFDTLQKMADNVANSDSEITLMGIRPTEPSSKFGYIIPYRDDSSKIDYFIEKPSKDVANKLISEGALWNAGVFAFRLGFIKKLLSKYINAYNFLDLYNNYHTLPKISFDYEVVEKVSSKDIVYFNGNWKDLGTWDTLSKELIHYVNGNAISSDCEETTVINELNIPIVCHGVSNIVIAASPDGILVANKDKAETVKDSVASINNRPMYEERRWGIYKVLDNVEFPNGFAALTKQLTLNPGCSISYQRHKFRDEVWTFIDGEGEIVIDGVRRSVSRGETLTIKKGQLHALKALTALSFIEVQQGSNLVEEDIERFTYDW